MTKIFRYELKRLVVNKFFFGLLAVILWFGWNRLTGVVILGVSNTAPFSPWSFGYYLSMLLPLLSIAELFFLTFFTSGASSRVQVLTNATPVSQKKYMLIRCGAVAAGYLLLILCLLLLSMIFYGMFFKFFSFGDFILPGLITILPALVFIMGIGWYAGQIHPALVYVLMAVVLLVSFLPLPGTISLTGSEFFINYPKGLDVLDPAFAVPVSFLLSRSVYTIAGLAFLIVQVRPVRRRVK